MLSIAVVLVLLSGLTHAVWNLFTKRSVNKVVFLWLFQWPAILLFLPFTVRELSTWEHPLKYGVTFLLLSVILHGVYVLLLAKTYTIGDLSQVYPIMRGTSPLLVPLLGVFLLGEHLPFAGWMGVVAIVTGIFFIAGMGVRQLSRLSSRVVGLALCVGVTITGYTVLDKITLQYIPPFALNEATNIGNLLALSWVALRSGAIRTEWRINWKTILLGGILSPGGYILFLEAIRIMPVAQIAPMREIGTVFGALLGVLILREPQGKRRIGAAVLIVAGVILLA